MNNQKPYLEKYAGPSSRHECPSCGDKHSFTYYLDGNTGKMIHETVGRCDRESKCGYHYPPREYFKSTRSRRPVLIHWPEEWGDEYEYDKRVYQHQPPQPPQKPDFIPEYFLTSFRTQSNFTIFLSSLFDSKTVTRLERDYRLGGMKNGAVIFWQIDNHNHIRTGKLMKYDKRTGKRLKNVAGAFDWFHSLLKRDYELPEDFSMVQCLFGEHLLKFYPDRVVALVESEKSAIIGAGVFPDYVWLATGGKSQMSKDKIRVLKGRTVVMFPDSDAYGLWCEKAIEMQSMGINAVVSDVIESKAMPEDKEAQIDIADWLIRDLRADDEEDCG